MQASSIIMDSGGSPGLNQRLGRPVAMPPLRRTRTPGNSLYWRFQFAGLADRFRVIAWNGVLRVFAEDQDQLG
jgi:hypothetical protein